mgnify:FL=1
MSKKAQEAARQEAAMKQAVEGAKRLFVAHERDRKSAELTDKASSDIERFTRAREEQRLRQELTRYVEVHSDIAYCRKLALQEYETHTGWEKLVECSWLPSVQSAADINAFLHDWRERQETLAEVRPVASMVNIRMKERQLVDSHWMRHDAPFSKDDRRAAVDDELAMCVLGTQLAELIARDADTAIMHADVSRMSFHRDHRIAVYEQIMSTLEKVSAVCLQYLDVFMEPTEEYLTRVVPAKKNVPPIVKFGMYVVATDKDRARYNRIAYQDLGISVDPKDQHQRQLPKNMTTRLPKTAVRVMQLNFDPMSVLCPPHQGQQHYALDCTFIAELLQLPEKVKAVVDWGCRLETAASLAPVKEPYRPTDSSRPDEWVVKFSFQVPENVVLRSKSPLIGKWIPGENCWVPCGTGTVSTELGIRKVSFVAAELTTMALIQEKGFDVPYDSWQLFPVADDEVILSIDCRKRGEPSSDRQVRIQVREAMCRLLAPEDRELTALRSQWLQPATLMRLLAQAGFNFLLRDADAAFVDNVLPKTAVMEAKGYNDLANFCTTHAFSNSRHNKHGEDPDMCLFRMSKAQRPVNAERTWYSTTCEGDAEEWHAIRYDNERCALAQFRESEESPTLSNLAGKETHLNLFTLLEAEYGTPAVAQRPRDSNQLLQVAVFRLLSLVRPFTWG